MSWLTEINRFVQDPDVYVGVGVGMSARYIYRVVVFSSSALTILGTAFYFLKKYPRVATTVVLLCVTFGLLSGCAAAPPMPKVGSKQVYQREYTIFPHELCSGRKVHLMNILRALHRRQITLTEQVKAGLAQAKLDYENCLGHAADEHVLVNPFNLYRGIH
jgi:predicted lipase